MLLRPAYLTVANTFVVLRLVPMCDRDKDIEILALRHQITVLERQLGEQKVRFTPGDRASGAQDFLLAGRAEQGDALFGQ